MNVVAAVFADFQQSPTGGASQLRTLVGGAPMLVHTLRRVARIEGLANRCLVVRARDRDAADEALQHAGVTDRFDLLDLDPGVRPRNALVQAARRWSLDAWRGNPLGMTWFDEYLDVPTAATVMNHYHCGALFCFDGHQPLLDPRIATNMIKHAIEYQNEANHFFTIAAPGLAGILLTHAQFQQLLEMQIPVGLLLSYRPEMPIPSPVSSSTCCHVPQPVTQAPARLVGDTRRSRELVDAALATFGPDVDAETLGPWLAEPAQHRAGDLPIEIELEVTTDRPLPASTLRPPPDHVPNRVLTDLEAVRRLGEELATYDDRLVWLAGHGDPLRFAQLGDVCQILRSAGVLGIGIETHLLDLSDETLKMLFDVPVDLIEVRLDALTPTTYQRVHGVDAYDTVVANIERIEAIRREGHPRPLVACSLTRCEATIDELEPFHDAWIPKVGTSVLRGYNDYCGSLPPDRLIPAWPPLRGPCRRLANRLMLLADGTVPYCSQDYRGKTSLGNWQTESLRAIWGSARLSDLRTAHETLALDEHPLCQPCTEWFRP